MFYARIIRLEETKMGAVGVLLLNNEIVCWTLEPDRNDPVGFQIPPGLYKCRKFNGYKFKDTFEILVPDHTALLFHPGNRESDTEGCVLLGERVGWFGDKSNNNKKARAVLGSRVAFDRFRRIVGDRAEFFLIIEDMSCPMV